MNRYAHIDLYKTEACWIKRFGRKHEQEGYAITPASYNRLMRLVRKYKMVKVDYPELTSTTYEWQPSFKQALVNRATRTAIDHLECLDEDIAQEEILQWVYDNDLHGDLISIVGEAGFDSINWDYVYAHLKQC